ncbi:MAG: ABC transporter permease [Candidatus Cloacimonetes bacterium]|nr:ABC transporter permease [Candidatus Cloacimonadota bacterium]
MLKNYLKIAFRNILQHKGFSIINISGLALGLAVFMLIMLWVHDEISYDRFHKKTDRLYRLVAQAQLGEQSFKAVVTPGEFPPYLKDKIPEIEEVSRYRPLAYEVLVKVGEKKFYKRKLACADSTFLRLFDFEVISGNVEDALTGVEKIILTKSTAEKYFGNDDPIGKTIDLYNGRITSTVTALIENLPFNTHFDFDMLISMKLLAPFDWGNHYFNGYFLLSENADPNLVVEKINQSIKERELEFSAYYYLQSIKDIHLKSDFDIDMANSTSEINKNVYIFTYIAFFILLIACINFMNLSTARSSKRAREVGIRKVVGAYRKNLMLQFMGESILISFLGMIFALVLVELFLPCFNLLTRKNINLMTENNFGLLLQILGLTTVTGIVAGFYPSLYLSSFKPILVMKRQTIHQSSKLRRIMVIIQFALSIILICGAIVVSNQLKYIQQKDLGFDRENLVYMRTVSGFGASYDKFRQELLALSEIENVTLSSDIPTNTIHLWGGFDWEGIQEDQTFLMNVYTVDNHFINTMKFNLLEGRAFSPEFDDTANYILNEAAVAYTGIEDPVGKRFSHDGNQGNIVGIVKDFNYKSIRTKVEPLVLRQGNSYQYVITRINSSNLEQTIEKMKAIWLQNYTEYPFEMHFLAADFEKLYETEQRTGKVFNYFTILAILISCLGLFGLASFTTEQRTKEIGVRKVLGASVGQIVGLLSSEYLKWVLVANLIAWPLAWYLMNKWLQNFAYRTNMNIWIFLLSSLIGIMIAMITISLQTFKAANANPMKALKYE